MLEERTQKTILVVEDDPWSRVVTAALFASEGYGVFEAKNGEEALSIAASAKVDAVLLDMALPTISGVDVLHALRSASATATVPVFVVSAYSDLLSEPVAGEATGVIRKPYDCDALLSAVAEALSSPTAAAA